MPKYASECSHEMQSNNQAGHQHRTSTRRLCSWESALPPAQLSCPTATNLWIFNSSFKSVLLWWSETWKKTKAKQQRIQTFINTCLRRIYNMKWSDKISNPELWDKKRQNPVGRQILKRKRSWIGHTSIKHKALTWNPCGRRKRGWPKNSWRRETQE